VKTKTVIFSDIDGTFLDDQYSYDCTKPIADKLTALDSSLVFCSSKTQKEIEYYRKAIGLNEPFIAENGAAIYIPRNYFPFSYTHSQTTASYNVIRLGTPYQTLRKKLEQIRSKTGAKIVGFGDMSLQELAQDTGLPMHLAELAKEREYDEPFRIIEGDKTQVLEAIKEEGLRCTQGGGKYFHLTGDHDKGKAAVILKNLYNQAFSQIETFAVGDGPNDLPMLKVVDKPFFIKKADCNSRFNAWTEILHHVYANR
jgi:mannosyl-3-phosphoglycerate phosphatase